MVPSRHSHGRLCLPPCKPCPPCGNSSIAILLSDTLPILCSRGGTIRPCAFPEEKPMTLTETTPTATSSTAAAYVRPQSGEYAPYYDRYICLVRLNEVPANDILPAFDDQRRQTLLLLSGRTEADGDLRYAPDSGSRN